MFRRSCARSAQLGRNNTKSLREARSSIDGICESKQWTALLRASRLIHAIVVCYCQCVDRSSMSFATLCERCRAPSVCFATFVGLPSLRNVCLSACDSQRQAHSSDRCNNAMLIYDRVVELLLRSGCLAVCLRFGSTRRAFNNHHESVCLRLGSTRAFDSQRLSICLRLGSRALVDA